MTKKILHLITHDIFTAGYINFMKIYMKEYDHTFIVSALSCSKDESIEQKLINEDNVIRYSSGKWLAFSPEIKRILKQTDKIIVSGIFGFEQMIYFWPRSAFEKMYLQYWGGDFYQVRDDVSIKDWRRKICRHMLISCFKRSYGAIYLIHGEYEKYKEITGITKTHVFVATMPGDPLKEFDYTAYRNCDITTPIRIVVGNSATYENQHIEVFRKLEHLKDEPIEIFCPLSYGEDGCAEEIKQAGKNMFGDKFHPITDWMELHEYKKFLASCHVGIFNNNRQQAMGNIFTMLQLCRKLYLKSNTSMYESYVNRGFVVHEVDELDTITLDELKNFSEKENNMRIAEEWTYMNNTVNEWKSVFDEK